MSSPAMCITRRACDENSVRLSQHCIDLLPDVCLGKIMFVVTTNVELSNNDVRHKFLQT